MDKFQESEAKQTIRLLIKDAAQSLHRLGLTYLGLPAERALDILALNGLLRNVICVDKSKTVLDETRRSIASMRLKERQFVAKDLWEYLRDDYPSEPLVADVSFLDFLGGGIQKADPFAQEIAGLRSYFAKHALHPQQAFVLAWTYMPRDKGPQTYKRALSRIMPQALSSIIDKSAGVNLRSVAIRLLLLQSLREHGMLVNVFHHALYKSVMSTLIIVYSKGVDPNCKLVMDNPDSLLSSPCCVYSPGLPTPSLVSLVHS
jgi:hypothetical protein